MKKRFPGVAALAAGIASTFNPAVRAAADRQRELEAQTIRFKVASEVMGYPITTEWAYAKALAGAPREVVEDERVHPYAWQLVADKWTSPNIDARKILEHYTQVFSGTPSVPISITFGGHPWTSSDPELLAHAIRVLLAQRSPRLCIDYTPNSPRTCTPAPADFDKIAASARPCVCDYQDLQPLGECICGANKPYNPANDGNKKG
jgi:hypothetical protein